MPSIAKTMNFSIAILEVQRIFHGNESELGTPQSPTKSGLLRIAKLGKTHWNSWRLRFPRSEVDFRDFLFESPMDFSGFNFPTIIKKQGHVYSCADFSGAIFKSSAIFDQCHFGDNAKFFGAKFESSCSFREASFGICPDFEKAKFDGDAKFDGAKFERHAFFQEIVANDVFSFANAEFNGNTSFLKATFNGISDFEGASFGYFAGFDLAQFKSLSIFRIPTSEEAKPGQNNFVHISFSGSDFFSKASFTGRTFKSSASFCSYESHEETKKSKETVFHQAPDFHNCKFHQDTNFDGAEFLEDTGPDAARAYRTLKLAMEQLKATREEQRFFRLEMKAEHPSLPKGKRWMSTLYSLFSDYGFSLWRPAAWLLALSLAFGTGYGALANACAGNAACIDIKAATDADAVSGPDRTSAVIKYTLGSVSPVPGLDKMQTELRAPLFGHQGWISITALALEILHKITTLVMTFLFALALRNLFKMKS